MAFSIASQAQTQPNDLQVGDSVMVNPDSTHYMTGEKISSWVYTVKHAIEQIESAFHPDGVLLKGIKSWVHRNAILSDKRPAAHTQEVVATEPTSTISDKVKSQPVQTDMVDIEEQTAQKATVQEPATQVAQGTNLPTRLVGRVVSSDNRAIANATITLANQGITTTTNADGEFTLTYLDPTDEEVILEANGYISDIQLIQLENGQLNNMGDILLQTDFVREAQDEVLLNIAEIDMNDDEGRSQSMSSATSASQDVFNSTISYAWSNARYRGRGYDQTHEQNYIEGISFNAAERGQFNFSAMGGLNDATRYREVVEGIEANNFTFGSLGLSTNYLQSASNYAQGWKVGVAGTNRNYKGAARATYSSGVMSSTGVTVQ